MATGATCLKCHAPLPPEAKHGFCPKCLFLNLTDPDEEFSPDTPEGPASGDSKPSPPPLSSLNFGNYTIEKEIGRGGMGMVYKARQLSVGGRRIALKILLGGQFADDAFVKRFRIEATAAGMLKHPNIVSVHEVGIHDGQHYIVMDYIEGSNLSTLCGNQPMALALAARIVKIIAEATHFAHEKGILHRDLKPSNVLIDAHQEPHITDFGLAKRLEEESLASGTSHFPTSVTLAGQVLGSPNYMPPEQISPEKGKVGRCSDIYSLGAILYHLLSGRPPFVGETLSGVLHQVLQTDASSPRVLNPNIPRDLETICLKCLEKDPDRRYATAQDLADDLQCYLNDEPIRARPVGRLEHFWRWCRRNRGLSLAYATVFLLLVSITLGSLLSAYRINQARLTARENLYAANMSLAQQAWDQNNILRLRQLLHETASFPQRNFEWAYWQKLIHSERSILRGHAARIDSLAFSPDSKRLLTASRDHTARVWDATTGRTLLTLHGHSAALRIALFSPDGRRILTASMDHSARLWDAATGRELFNFQAHPLPVQSAAFFPDGRRVITGSDDFMARVWDFTTGQELFSVQGHVSPVYAVAVSPDGRLIATSGDDKPRLWDAANGKLLHILQGHRPAFIMGLAFSPDSQRLVSGGFDGFAKIWDVHTGAQIHSLDGHIASILGISISPDGQQIATSSEDRTVKVWDSATGWEKFTLRGHLGEVSAVAFSPDGQWIATASGNQAVIWPAHSQEHRILNRQTKWVSSATFSPDGRRIVSAGQAQLVNVSQASTGRELLSLPGHGEWISTVVFSPDGLSILSCSSDWTARVWDATSGLLKLTLRGHTNAIYGAVYSPDGRWIATASGDLTVKLWDPATGQEQKTLRTLREGVQAVAISPDSQSILASGDMGTVKLWDLATGQERLSLSAHSSVVHSVAFSPDTRFFATASADRTARIWDASTGQLRVTLSGHNASIYRVAFSPDGQRIITASEDRTARLWEVSTGKELLTLKGHNGLVSCANFSPDGLSIVTSSSDATLKLWDAASPEQIATWLSREQPSPP